MVGGQQQRDAHGSADRGGVRESQRAPDSDVPRAVSVRPHLRPPPRGPHDSPAPIEPAGAVANAGGADRVARHLLLDHAAPHGTASSSASREKRLSVTATSAPPCCSELSA